MPPSKIRGAVLAALTVALAGTPPRTARAQPRNYRPEASPNGAAGIRIDVPYTLGTHTFEVHALKGEVRVDWEETPVVVSGRLIVPLASVRGGGDTLNCHMREAMGLDYTKSAFPGSHVCSGGQLPTSGNDAVAFPEIAFDITRVITVGGASSLISGGTRRRVAVTGRWTIHGISRDDTIDLQLTVRASERAHPRSIRLEGVRKIRLTDYGIQVKRALIIAAGDDATVRFDLSLEARD